MVAFNFERYIGSWPTFGAYCCTRGREPEKPAIMTAAAMAVKEEDDDTSSMVDSAIQGGTHSMKI